MKNLFLGMFLFFSTIGFSQQEKKEEKPDLTVDQKVELHSKRMKLDLDLSDAQLVEVKKLLKDLISKKEVLKKEMKEKKKNGEKLSGDDIFKLQNSKLDDELVMRKEMKRILRPEQYIKWEQIANERKEKHRGKMEKRKGMKMHDDDLPPSKE